MEILLGNLGEPWIFAAVFLLSLLVMLGFTRALLPLLRRLNLGQRIREDGPERHLLKEGTPTMGGVAFVLTLVGVTAVALPRQEDVWLLLCAVAGAAALGFADDFLKVSLNRPLGLRGRAKLFGQILLGVAVGWTAAFYLGRGTEIAVPWIGTSWDVGLAYPAFSALLFTATTNAVNITDGLDGLAAGSVAISSLVLIAAALARAQLGVALFAVALLGVCIAFLWYNFYPARIIMGDTGSLALGGALAALAVLTATELLLIVACGLFVVETLSVIIQVAYFQWTGGRRIFRMSPLHHHFELAGHSETTVVLGMWAFQLICAGLAFWGLRGMGA